jgi:ribonuclease D
MDAWIVQVITRPRLPHIVTTPPELAGLIERVSAHPRLGLDTEFLRERTYRAQLCLVQLASPEEAACIDPLALADLAPLAAVLETPGVLKVMHASRQDLEVLLPLARCVRPLLDTQVAAALVGLPAQIGYSELTRRLLGHGLPKTHTRTDWSHRPLSAAQIEYALDDVRYLLPLAAQLEEQIARLGRSEWLQEELAALGGAAALAPEPENAWLRIRGLRELDPGRERLARALAAWRERRASESNRPRGWILDDAVLREIVLRVPRTPAALAQIPDIPAAVVKRRGAELLAAVEAAAIPDPVPPAAGRARPDPAKAALVKKLAGIIQTVARELNLVPEVLATRRDLERLAEGARDGAVLRGWRRTQFGERLLAAL